MTPKDFKPKNIAKKLLAVLPERAMEVLTLRYGLGKEGKKLTLDAIGQKYGITRERVRQIENYALNTIRKSSVFKSEIPLFEGMEESLHSLGGIVVESDLLAHFSKDALTQNHINFLLTLGDSFKKRKEDEHFNPRWYIHDEHAEKIEESLKKLFSNLRDEDLLPETEIVRSFLEHLEEVSEKYKNQEILKRWLTLSKKIGQNPLGEWGVTHSPNIRTKGMRDYAFLIIRKNGSPMHFREVAKQIEKVFKKKAHVATCHNELIKDPRFVLVGRGLYALKEWGYATGVVRDVIASIIEKHGPLSKEDITEKVFKERYVKENTIMVNLQNQKYFKKNKDNKYEVVK